MKKSPFSVERTLNGKRELNVGDKLANGALVVAVRGYPCNCLITPCHEPYHARKVVLAWNGREYVTWVAEYDSTQVPVTGSEEETVAVGWVAFWGHYLGSDIEGAAKDFSNRSAYGQV